MALARSASRRPDHNRWNNTGQTTIGSPTCAAPASSSVGSANPAVSADASPGRKRRGCRYPASDLRFAAWIESGIPTRRYIPPTAAHARAVASNVAASRSSIRSFRADIDDHRAAVAHPCRRGTSGSKRVGTQYR